MNAPLAPVLAAAVKEPRDFTFIKPRKRRLTEYEAVTVHQQWEPGGFDCGGWFLLAPDGRTEWRPESTALRHPDWFEFRDPAQHWQRTYVRMQAEQERALERMTEDAAADGSFAAIDPAWLEDILVRHYRVWSFFEYGLFRAFAPAQREALSDTIGNALCFQSFDHMRHAQAIVSHLLAIEGAVAGFADQGAKARWTDDPQYQPSRRLVEEIITSDDWAEIAVVTNLVVAPLLSEIAVAGLVRKPAPLHGDVVTPAIIMTAERDRRRNLAYTLEFVAMVTAEGLVERAHNQAVIAGWLQRWQPRVLAACRALAPIAQAMPNASVDFDALLGAALAQQHSLLANAGFAGAIA